jgi:leucyl-tRNA synthetase
MYYARITDYAEELLEHVDDKLPGWPERVRTMQTNWIGKSTGVRFAFPHEIKDADGADRRRQAVCLHHPSGHHHGRDLLRRGRRAPAGHAGRANQSGTGRLHRRMQAGLRDRSRHGDDGEEGHADRPVRHPSADRRASRSLGRQLRADDLRRRRRDGRAGARRARFRLRQKYNLPIKQVIKAEGQNSRPTPGRNGTATRKAIVTNSGKYDGLRYAEAVDAVAADLAAKGLGEKKTTFRLRDWGISRQRYWGTPIPMIHCADCGSVPVPEKTCRWCCRKTAYRTAAATR